MGLSKMHVFRCTERILFTINIDTNGYNYPDNFSLCLMVYIGIHLQENVPFQYERSKQHCLLYW